MLCMHTLSFIKLSLSIQLYPSFEYLLKNICYTYHTLFKYCLFPFFFLPLPPLVAFLFSSLTLASQYFLGSSVYGKKNLIQKRSDHKQQLTRSSCQPNTDFYYNYFTCLLCHPSCKYVLLLIALSMIPDTQNSFNKHLPNKEKHQVLLSL